MQEYRIYVPALGRGNAAVQLFLPFFGSPMQKGSLQGSSTVSMPRQPGFVQRVGENLQLNGQSYNFVGTNVSYLAGPFFPEANAEEIVALGERSGSR